MQAVVNVCFGKFAQSSVPPRRTSLTATLSSATSRTGGAISGTYDASKEGFSGVWDWWTARDEEKAEEEAGEVAE